jgi:hypothetical protein
MTGEKEAPDIAKRLREGSKNLLDNVMSSIDASDLMDDALEEIIMLREYEWKYKGLCK